MAASPLSLKSRALQWLAQREHSRVELRRKLLGLARLRLADGAADAGLADTALEVEALLDWLSAGQLLSDTRFAESRVNARAARYGNLRIRHELKQHAVALEATLNEQLQDSELARAHAVWARKYGKAPPAAAADRARQMRFLAGRGFSADVVRRVVRGTEPGDHD